MATKWRINISSRERATSIGVGLAGIGGGLSLLAGDTSSATWTVIVVLEVLLMLAGLGLVITGATGHCPLQRRVGRVVRAPLTPKTGRHERAQPPS